MTKKILKSIFSVAAVSVLAGLLVTMGVLYEHFINVQDRYLMDELNLASKAVEQNGEEYLRHFGGSDFRLTLVAPDGTVRFDTKKDASKMENHAEREEIRVAMETGRGASSRYSKTLLAKSVYKAKRLKGGDILRISVSHTTVGALFLGTIQPILFVVLMILIVSAILASRLAKRIVEPLNKLDLNQPLDNIAYEEVSPILRKIHNQQLKINSQINILEAKKNEFLQITANMQEALILLTPDCVVLSMNNAAFKLFKTGRQSLGKRFISIDRTRELSSAIAEALAEGRAEVYLQREERIYQCNISKISSVKLGHEENGGVIILAFDVTERVRAEKSRREFTANVSHELKTPLQAIIGSAELIENDLVRSEDIPRFIDKIKTAADGLVTLIDDIIHLSHIDEGFEEEKTAVNVYDLAEEVVSSLEDYAERKRVSIYTRGESVVLPAFSRTMLREALYNLCDNSIKYNVPDGMVWVDVSEADGSAVVTVKDTGIGIPAGDQERVFERFYRVDKSHSRETGGTGLGLAIVKHAVACHKGRVLLHSVEGEGTEVTLLLPINRFMV